MHDAPEASTHKDGEDLTKGEARPANNGATLPAEEPAARTHDASGTRSDLRHNEMLKGERPGDRYIRQSRDVGQGGKYKKKIRV